MTIIIMGDEVVTGGVIGIALHMARIDIFRRPQFHQSIAEHIASKRGQITDTDTLARGSDRTVGGVAAEPLQKRSRRLLVEFDHRLADADDIGPSILYGFKTGVDDDIPIWREKVYRENPVLCDGDGPINKHRKWTKQFYDMSLPG